MDKVRTDLVSRRTLLRTAAALGIAAPFGIPGTRVLAAGEAVAGAKAIKLAWNSGAVCGAGTAVALHNGIFARHNLNVEFVNFAGSTEQLLEAIATGKADAGIGMAL